MRNSRRGRVTIHVLMAGIMLLGCSRIMDFLERREADKDPEAAKREREQRHQVVAEVAPAPIPTSLPLIERAGTDAWGYPKSYVDGPGLRALLNHQRFTELTAFFEQFQREFETDPLKELWPIRAAESFASAEPELRPLLDAWVKSAPSSFAPYLARGTYLVDVAWAERGGGYSRETHSDNFKAMKETAALARKDLEHALDLDPRLIAADRMLVSMAIATSDEALADSALQHAKNTCPSCFFVRSRYMTQLQPRWGGSFQAMQAFAEAEAKQPYPRLKLLAGYVEQEQAAVARQSKDLEAALAHANAACAIGDHWDFLSERALVYWGLNDLEQASADMDRAVDLAPDFPSLIIRRAQIRSLKEDWEGAAQDLIAGIRVDATNDDARKLRPYLAFKLLDAGTQAHQAGHREDAIRLLELAEGLAPGDPKIRAAKDLVVRNNLSGAPDEVADLEEKAKANPNDFRIHQQLDFVLAKSRKYDRVIAMWTEYLEQNPDDGPAYFERAGAYHNSGHNAEAYADVGKACTLGVNAACAHVKHAPK